MSIVRTVPDDVYVDTSVIVAAMVNGSHYSQESRRFCTRLALDGSRVYFSQISRIEVSQAVARMASNPGRLDPDVRSAYGLDRWDMDFMVRNRWMSTMTGSFDTIVDEFAASFEVPFDSDIWRRSIPVMAHYRMRSMDAIHVASARSLGVRALATNDDHFRRVDGLNVILVRDA